MTKKNNLNETELQIACVYLCQMLGQPTPSQILKIMDEKMNVLVNETAIINALNSAKKRGLLSVNHIQNPETQEVENAFSMKDLRFSNPPEIAHIKNVLPTLLEDEGTKEMFNLMEDNHLSGEKKGGRLPDIRDYKTWKVIFTNILPVLGGEPFQNNDNDDTKVKAVLKLRRIDNETIWIPANLWLRGAIRDELRVHNVTESKALYVKVNDYFFKPKNKIIQIALPSPAQTKGGAGTGITTFEALSPNEEFQFVIKFPTKGGISEDVMKKILKESNIRIGARHKDYGLLQLKEIKVLD